MDEIKINVSVPNELIQTLDRSYETIDKVRESLIKIYETNQSPKSNELLLLEKQLILENFQLKRQSDIYYQNIKYYQDKLINNKSNNINKSIYKDSLQIQLRKCINELNTLLEKSMILIGQIPELKIENLHDLSRYDKSKIDEIYSRDKILLKLSKLQTKLEITNYNKNFQNDINSLIEIINFEKLQRFKLFILNKSLYSNRIKKLKELDLKWSKRLDDIIKFEKNLITFNEKLNEINNDNLQNDDDLILAGLNNNESESESESELDEGIEEGEEEQEEETNQDEQQEEEEENEEQDIDQDPEQDIEQVVDPEGDPEGEIDQEQDIEGEQVQDNIDNMDQDQVDIEDHDIDIDSDNDIDID